MNDAKKYIYPEIQVLWEPPQGVFIKFLVAKNLNSCIKHCLMRVGPILMKTKIFFFKFEN